MVWEETRRLWMRAMRLFSKLEVTPGTIGIWRSQAVSSAAGNVAGSRCQASGWHQPRRACTYGSGQKLEARIEVEVLCLEKVSAGRFAREHDDGGLHTHVRPHDQPSLFRSGTERGNSRARSV